MKEIKTNTNKRGNRDLKGDMISILYSGGKILNQYIMTNYVQQYLQPPPKTLHKEIYLNTMEKSKWYYKKCSSKPK